MQVFFLSNCNILQFDKKNFIIQDNTRKTITFKMKLVKMLKWKVWLIYTYSWIFIDGPRPLGDHDPQLLWWWSWGQKYFEWIPRSKWSGTGPSEWDWKNQSSSSCCGGGFWRGGSFRSVCKRMDISHGGGSIKRLRGRILKRRSGSYIESICKWMDISHQHGGTTWRHWTIMSVLNFQFYNVL